MSGDLFGSCINGNPCPKTCLPPGYKDATYPQFGNTFPSFTTSPLALGGFLTSSASLKFFAYRFAIYLSFALYLE